MHIYFTIYLLRTLCLPSFLEAERRADDIILYRPTDMRLFSWKSSGLLYICSVSLFLCHFDLLALVALVLELDIR
jgi:hypothetical protein